MIQLRVEMNKLGEYVADQLRSRDMSLRQFEVFTGISYVTISNMMSSDPPDPSLDTLSKLAQATKVDICVFVAMVKPEATKLNPKIQLIANHIVNLPPDQIERYENELIGLAFKSDKKSE